MRAPVIKSYLSDLAVSNTLSAQQVFGGHGYVREHGMEQNVRDSRISPIYEGTNEIHAIDLVARKMTGRIGQRRPNFNWRLSPGKKFRWEAGVFWGVDSQSPNQTFKLNFEFEF